MQAFDMFGASEYAGTAGSMPDHSLLKLVISTGPCNVEVTNTFILPDKPIKNSLPPNDIFYERFRIEVVPDNFMSSDMVRNTLLQLIQDIESNMTSQEDIDHFYSKLSSIYHGEMHNFFRSSNTYPGMKKKFYRKSRTFWNNDLQELWNEVRRTEHIFT